MRKTPLNDWDKMPFGPYVNRPMKQVPAKYLLGLLNNKVAMSKYPCVDAYIRKAERVLRWELKNEERHKD